MMLSRRNLCKYTFLATSVAGLSAAAATAAPVQAIADDPELTEFNVQDYGAVADDTRDDTAAIHAARDAADIGGRLVFPPGVYSVSGLTANVENQTWELADGAVIKLGAGARKVLSVTAPGVSVVGGVFDCSNGTDPDTQSGIFITADGASIRDAKIERSPSYGIRAGNCNQITIAGCVIVNSGFEAIFVQNGSTGPPNISGILIADNIIDNSSGGEKSGGIYTRGESTTQRVDRVTIRNNNVRLASSPTYETGGIIAFNCSDYSVSNNLVSGGYLGITCDNPINALISNNEVRGFSGFGIEIPGAVDNVTITSNVIDSEGTSATAGIQSSAGSVNQLNIAGNSIKGFVGDCYLISFNSGSIAQGVKITDNSLTSSLKSGSFTGVYFNRSVTGLTMWGNLVDGSSSPKAWGVQFLKSVMGAFINKNQFTNLAGAAVLMGSYEAGESLDFIAVVDNEFANCGATLKDATANGAVVGANIFT